MELNYHLDLLHLCNVNAKQIAPFFRFAFDVIESSQRYTNETIKENFYKNDDILLHHHKSGKPLAQLIFEGNGELANRIIPALWNIFHSTNNSDEIKYGEVINGLPDLHPNAKLTTISTGNIWELSNIGHYHFFRNYHIKQKILSSDCEKYIQIYLPKIELTKKALTQYKNMSIDDKLIIISDLKKLDNYITKSWKNVDFPIDRFSKETGVSASDESDTTKQNPTLKELRKFKIPNFGSVYCFLHIKISNTYRIHFYPDGVNKKVYIAYIGKHLKTARFK